MNIAILSGKGGTGKTTISTNLALALSANYIDCDVEEPNGFLFLKPKIIEKRPVMLEYPFIDDDKCIYCGDCVKACQFNALAKINDDIMLFQKLCHACGACKIVCKYDALTYKKREIGQIEIGSKKNINCSRGVLNISEPIAVPVIRELLNNLNEGINLIDCPPGTSCNVVSTLQYADRAILVTEPSKFGLHDLKRAAHLVKMYDIPYVVVINKDDGKNNIVKQYCNSKGIDILGVIPYNKNTAALYSRGKILYEDDYHKELFDNLSEKIRRVLNWI